VLKKAPTPIEALRVRDDITVAFFVGLELSKFPTVGYAGVAYG